MVLTALIKCLLHTSLSLSCKAVDIDLWVFFNAWLIVWSVKRESVAAVEESWKKIEVKVSYEPVTFGN